MKWKSNNGITYQIQDLLMRTIQIKTDSQLETLIVYRGKSFFSIQECGAECIKCGRQIVFNLPAPAVPGANLQFIHKSVCSCGMEFYTMTAPNGQGLLGTGYECSTDGVWLKGAVNLEFRDGFQEFLNPKVLRIQSKPFVVEKGADGKFQLKNT